MSFQPCGCPGARISCWALHSTDPLDPLPDHFLPDQPPHPSPEAPGAGPDSPGDPPQPAAETSIPHLVMRRTVERWAIRQFGAALGGEHGWYSREWPLPVGRASFDGLVDRLWRQENPTRERRGEGEFPSPFGQERPGQLLALMRQCLPFEGEARALFVVERLGEGWSVTLFGLGEPAGDGDVWRFVRPGMVMVQHPQTPAAPGLLRPLLAWYGEQVVGKAVRLNG